MWAYQRNIRLGRMKAYPIVGIGDNSEERVEQARHGGKIILPNFVLRRVANRANQSIMIFKLINEEIGRHVFCGVFTFEGEEPRVSVPLWILKQLQIQSGNELSVESVTATIPKGVFAKFEPLTRLFLEINDPKTVLEHSLRGYVCITAEDVISIYYNRNVYELRVCETLPSETIIINECDLTVDFKEMKPTEEDIQLPAECDLDVLQTQVADDSKSFSAFSGVGQSISGRNVRSEEVENNSSESSTTETTLNSSNRGIPDFDYKIGNLYFKRHKKDLITNEKQKSDESLQKQRKRLVRRPITRSQTQPFRNPNRLQPELPTAGTGTQNPFTANNRTKRRKPNENSNVDQTD